MNTIKYRRIVLILAAGGLLTLAMGILLTQPGRAEGPWYVAPGGDDGDACTSPGTACATINGAIGKASSGDTIYVAIGTYTDTGDEVVLLDKDVVLSGGWDETFTSQNGTSTIDGEGARRGITVVGNSTATVEYVTIRNGSAHGGGGIDNYQGTLILDNSTISGNSSDWVGGGIYSFAGTLTLNNSTVSGNTADGGGGGIGFSGTLILDNSAVSGNRANGGGGGIYSYVGTLTLNNSTVSGNTANQGGGGISNYQDTLTTLNDSTVSGNIANGNGGGISNVGVATLILNHSTVSGNSSDWSGGGISNAGTLTLNNSTVSGNSSDREGGGISNAGTLTLNNSTVSANSSYGEGGGIFDREGGTVTLQNTILAGNTTFGVGPDCGGTIGSLGYNLVGDTVNCDFIASTGDLLDVDAGLVPLASLLGYFPLLPDSPAIDAGNPAGCTDDLGSPLDTDQRGASRVGRCDIGAYEYTAPGPADSIAAVDGTPQRTPPFLAFEMPLQAAVLDSIGSPVDNVTVTFSAPASGASGTFADSGTYTTTAVTDKGGIAIAAKLTANGLEGSYTVTAIASGVVAPASFLLTNIGWYVSLTGNDDGDCQTPTTPCATIGGPLGKPSFAPGDTVLVATGTYTGTGAEVVLLDKSVQLLGGWDDTFAMQSGTSIIDAEGARRGMTVDNDVTAIVRRITIQNGSACEGGGIANRGTLTLDGCAVSDNGGDCFPPSHGGGIVNRGILTLNNSTVSDNVNELGYGGGFANYAFLILSNSTVSGNTAYRGGGIWSSGSLTLNSSTVSGNMAANDGGGIYSDDGTVTVHNTILAGNGGDSGPDCSGTIGSVGYNLTGDASGCIFASTTGDLINIEPWLGPLVGSPAVHVLSPGSPAIDAANPAGCTDRLGNPLTADQRGTLRPLDGDDDGSAICDIGAYEFDPANPTGQVFLPIITRNYCRSLYGDDFSDPGSGWPISDDGNIRYEYLDGEYRILVRNTNWWAGAAPGFKASDYIVAVDVRNVTAVYGSYGLIFGLSDNWSQFYSFEIDPDGNYGILQYDSGTWKYLAWGTSGTVNTGAATNRLKVERTGSLIRAYANGQLLTSVSNSRYGGSRRVGLIVSTYNHSNVDVRFDNFIVYPVTCGTAATALSQTGEAPNGGALEIGQPNIWANGPNRRSR